MSAAPLRDMRWTLAQALVWVLSRDCTLTEQAGAEPVDPLWIAVRCCAVADIGPASAWGKLRSHIIAGRIRADGRPGDYTGPRGNREDLKVVAPDLRLDGERHSPGRECFLSGDAVEQSCWYAVEMLAENVVVCFPAKLAVTFGISGAGVSVPVLQEAIIRAKRELWPGGIPKTLRAGRRNSMIVQRLKPQIEEVSDATIRRALRAERS